MLTSTNFGKVIILLIWLLTRAAATAILVLPSLRFDLSGIKCKFKEEREKSVMLFLHNGDIITVCEGSKATDLWTKPVHTCESSKIYCRLKEMISISALKVLLSILENYSNDLHPTEKYIAELLAENDNDNGLTEFCDKLQLMISASGISESAFVLQGLLKKMMSKKRWKLIRTFRKVIGNYYQFIVEYYSPPSEIKLGGRGYVSAMDSFNCKRLW